LSESIQEFAVRSATRFLLLIALTISSLGFSQTFGPVVKVTPTGGFGYEPSFVADHYGNLFGTAHKENWQLVLAPDVNSPTYTRSMSWDWISSDNGASWQDLQGLTPLSIEQHEFGDEGDMTLDDSNHLYFVDTNVTDDTFTRWAINGLGSVTLETTRPLIPAAQLVDDRPWIIAHGAGHVFYFGNEGDKTTYPLGTQGIGCGPGRYTVYPSLDGGNTFNSLGCTLPDSGWCRPATDHRAGYHLVYAVCGNDGGSDDLISPTNPLGTLYAYSSPDDGQTWSRHVVGSYSADDSTTSWPSVMVGPDGTIWALFVDTHQLECSTDITGATTCNPDSNRLMLYQSMDQGVTWKGKDITPTPGRYRYAWLALSNDGKKLGVGLYYSADPTTLPWKVYGAIFNPWQKPQLVSLDDANPVASAGTEPSGDYMGSYFSPDGTLGVIWTRRELAVPGASVERSIYFSHSLP
jgi:hypothetical protein